MTGGPIGMPCRCLAVWNCSWEGASMSWGPPCTAAPAHDGRLCWSARCVPSHHSSHEQWGMCSKGLSCPAACVRLVPLLGQCRLTQERKGRGCRAVPAYEGSLAKQKLSSPSALCRLEAVLRLKAGGEEQQGMEVLDRSAMMLVCPHLRQPRSRGVCAHSTGACAVLGPCMVPKWPSLLT
eukprot:1158193-Pelagomonas_calceolata.AAC.1